MPKVEEAETVIISTPVPADFRERLRKLAEIENRSLAAQIRHLLEYALPLHEKTRVSRQPSA